MIGRVLLEDVRGALVAREQVCAVFGIKERAQSFDAARDEHEVIFAEREDGVDQVVALAFIPQMLLQTVRKERKQIERIQRKLG